MSAQNPPESHASAAKPPRKRRVPFWDNARFACIVLVVLGHALQRLTYDSDIAQALYLLIYAFHMPAFAIISGYFSRSGAPSSRQAARVLTDLLVPYFIFDGLWALTNWLVEGRGNPNPTYPAWTLWFLLALAIFRVVLPYLALLRWPLAWALLISISVGYFPNLGETLSLARVFGLLPFFMLGWWLREHDIVVRLGLLRARPWWTWPAAVAVLAIAGWVAWRFVDVWREVSLWSWLFFNSGYARVEATEWWAGGFRLLQIAIALLLCAALFTLLPRRTHWWTKYGRYTMYAYLLHSFVLYPFRESGALRGLDPTWLVLPIVIVASILIAIAVSSKPIRRIFRPVIEPRPKWLFSDPSLGSREGRRDDPTGARRPRDGS